MREEIPLLEMRKLIREKPYLLENLPEFHRTVLLRLIGESDGVKERG